MTRRHDLEPGYRRWLLELGQGIARLRAQRGWTQASAAAHCGLEIKQYQDMEYGRRPVSTRTLYAMAHAFGVPMGALLEPDQGEAPAHAAATRGLTDTDTARLQQAGWRLAELDGRRKPAQAIPIFDLTAAAGPLGPSQMPAVVAWAVPSEGRRQAAEGLFLARVAGQSMAPQVPSGSWCLFRQPAAEPLLGKLVLVRVADSGYDSGAWLFKRIGDLSLEDGSRVLRLDSLNPEFGSVSVQLGDDSGTAILAELVRVVAAGPPATT
ncbi:MAG: helix-turn-helix domain-containing protein [Deltaproteobacteria bacterium]|nr:helix-turn-helix domain-containing protein [Deltaproteobacteria bacterium]